MGGTSGDHERGRLASLCLCLTSRGDVVFLPKSIKWCHTHTDTISFLSLPLPFSVRISAGKNSEINYINQSFFRLECDGVATVEVITEEVEKSCPNPGPNLMTNSYLSLFGGITSPWDNTWVPGQADEENSFIISGRNLINNFLSHIQPALPGEPPGSTRSPRGTRWYQGSKGYLLSKSSIDSTSGRLHSEFIRLLFLQVHRETDRFFEASGVQLAETNSGLFHFRRAGNTVQFKSSRKSSV